MQPIWAIPGFLGLSADWEVLQWPSLKGINPFVFPWQSLSEWGKNFNQWVGAQTTQPACLMGYSLGGRLALHALLDHPAQWQAAIIVSAHPGLVDSQERVTRQQRDQLWAERFQHEEWHVLMQAWNAQEIFAQDTSYFQRQESDYQRDQLAHALICGSLGQQADLRAQIESLPLPLLWITGALDERYSQMAHALKFAHPLSRWVQVPEVGHRVPWAAPQKFKQALHSFQSLMM
jgi:2-succinyl-6-hydroxy-2,4-cyclohexadiene-1-carboxylate synthase